MLFISIKYYLYVIVESQWPVYTSQGSKPDWCIPGTETQRFGSSLWQLCRVKRKSGGRNKGKIIMFFNYILYIWNYLLWPWFNHQYFNCRNKLNISRNFIFDQTTINQALVIATGEKRQTKQIFFCWSFQFSWLATRPQFWHKICIEVVLMSNN